MNLLEALNLSDEYIGPPHWLCGLCGNSGMVDTVGRVYSGAGIECGVRAPCVCANGRAIKRQTTTEVKPEPKTFWVSWNEYSDEETPKLSSDSRIIAWWGSGEAFDGSYSCVVAWIYASNFSQVQKTLDKEWPCEGDRDWRFASPCAPDSYPGGDRFLLGKKEQARAKRFKLPLTTKKETP